MKKLLQIVSAPWLMGVCLISFALAMAFATFFENKYGTPAARHFFYNAKWFEAIILVGVINLISSIFIRKLYRIEKFSIFLFHLSFIVIIIGAGATRYLGFEGIMQIREGESTNQIMLMDRSIVKLPFSIYLKDFIIDYYPGSQNPSGYESKVILVDKEKKLEVEKRIYMNNILVHRGYRFYQADYPEDQKGTVLQVSKDGIGTPVTYMGYILLLLGIVWSLVNKNSRFYLLFSKKTLVLFFFISGFSGIIFSQSSNSLPVISKSHAEKFGSILVRDIQGRTKPLTTLTSDILRKISHKSELNGQTPDQALLGMLAFPENWQNVKFIYAGADLARVMKLTDTRVSIAECYLGGGRFVTTDMARIAIHKEPSSRSKAENSLIKFDERLNITFQWFMGEMLTIFPVPDNSNDFWFSPLNINGKVKTEDSIFVYNAIAYYLDEVRNSVKSGDWTIPDKTVEAINRYQRKYGTVLPSETKTKVEQYYDRSKIFQYASYLYQLFGLILLLFGLITIFTEKKFPFVNILFSGAILGVFLLHTFGIIIRWYISGRAPWTDSYESMLLFGWAFALAGCIFMRRNITVSALAAIMASIFLLVAHMAWMDPQITNLKPVLNSIWLVIHVEVITTSYGFLGVGAVIAFLNLFIMAVQSRRNIQKTSVHIKELTRIIEITVTIGLYLLTIGTFLGAVWANESWGRYWGWDSKETWALITVIIYAFVLHLRHIPGLYNEVSFNILALLAFGSVLMTYFGVNYYLSGMHSYASGSSDSLPFVAYITTGIVILISLLAALNRFRLSKRIQNSPE